MRAALPLVLAAPILCACHWARPAPAELSCAGLRQQMLPLHKDDREMVPHEFAEMGHDFGSLLVDPTIVANYRGIGAYRHAHQVRGCTYPDDWPEQVRGA